MTEEFQCAGSEGGREAALTDGESHKDTWSLAKDEKNWLAYRLVHRSGKKPQKIPQNRLGKNTGAKNAATLTFDEAWELASGLGSEFGIGYHQSGPGHP